MLSLNSIRSIFIDYFKDQHHQHLPSSSLIPHNDPTLMFTNAGMVQFKNLFTGEEKRNYQRAVTSQKCVRAGGKHNDLDNVGYTARHHTFFEMLGNFSFGDYFKEHAILYAWECLTKHLSLPKEKLYITVYHNDDEAIGLWKKIAGLNDDRIIRISTNDNFWSMGDVGPCGPCSEIFYDHGEKIFGGLPGTKDADGDRFIEIWNLVFMQFEQLADGSRINLPKSSIDTGMGIERIAAILQNAHNNYEVDLFKNIIDYTAEIVKKNPLGDSLGSYRVIADHLRSTAFLVADGVMPSNEGRGYVLRRIMRRAMRHIHALGYNDLLMHQLVPALIIEMGAAYPELIRAQKLIEDVFTQEEQKFKSLLSRGMRLLDDETKSLSKNGILSGEVAFKLYDTYGFPLDLTVDILKSREITVNENEFNQQMTIQKERARAAWAGSGEQTTNEIWFDIVQKFGPTEFLGYCQNDAEAQILAIIDFDEQHKLIVTNQTPFYAESGGQVGDIGYIIDQYHNKYTVTNTLKFLGKIHAHLCAATNLQEGQNIRLEIDQEFRTKVRANHSSAHLLHHALRNELGEHVAQKGSLVNHERLRFDLSHSKPISAEEIYKIEVAVNDLIRKNFDVATNIMNLDDAVNSGAVALFGEKYEDEVRVVRIGHVVELCGGTHVNKTGDIGFFKIIAESAIASGIRRIEAITGETAINYIQQTEYNLDKIASLLKCSTTDIDVRVENLMQEKRNLDQELKKVRLKLLLDAHHQCEPIGKYNLIIKLLDGVNPQDLRSLVDELRNKTETNIVLAIAKDEGKTSIIVGLHKNNSELDAATIIRLCVEATGGQGGGGKKDIAQAGGVDFTKSELAINAIKQYINK